MSMELGSQSHLESKTAHYLTKLNTSLVAIVKQEWTTSWKSFITDICSYGGQGEAQCENALSILKLLSEEIFDFSKVSLTKK